LINLSKLKNQYIFTNFSTFSASTLFLMVDHTKSYVEKPHSVDAELAGHAHKLDMKFQRLCGNGFSVCCGRACQALPLWSELTSNTLRKQRWATFFYPQFWMP